MSGETPAVDTLRRFIDAVFARDWDALADTLAADFRFEDRRPGLQDVHDKASEIERSRATVDLGVDAIDIDVMETRGDRLALIRGKVHFADTRFVIATHLGLKFDDDNRRLVGVLFGDEDEDAARSELDSLANMA